MLKKVLKKNMNFDLDLYTTIDFRLLKGSPKNLEVLKYQTQLHFSFVFF